MKLKLFQFFLKNNKILTKLSKISQERISPFTDSQALGLNEIMDAVTNNHSPYQCIDARGGTGKQIVLNAVIASANSIESDDLFV
jgi:hypothetical protein